MCSDQKSKFSDEGFRDRMLGEGYIVPHKLPTGKWAGVMQMNFTGGLFVGLDDHGYEKRYCYETIRQAAFACLTWDGEGDPPGNWIKEKGDGVDRINPKIQEEWTE